MGLLPPDFESGASTSFAIPALVLRWSIASFFPFGQQLSWGCTEDFVRGWVITTSGDKGLEMW